jgi:D-galactarolactone cycloisomerase
VIERAEVVVLSHRLSRTRLFSTGSNVTRDSVVVRVEDRVGRVGWGETYLVPGAVEACQAMAGELAGREADEACAELIGRPGLHRWALGAVTMALDDLRARARGIPVSALYGTRVRDRVRPYASSRGYVEGSTPVEAWTKEAAAMHEAGFRAMKLRIGRYDLDGEIAAIEQVVANTAPMTWMADGNGAFTFGESRRLGERLEVLGFRWLEEPLPTSDYFAYAPLARELAIPLAGGEILESAADASPFLAAGSFDLIQPDVSICGGIAGLLDITRAAVAVGRVAVPHACSGAIAMAATLQILAVLDTPDSTPPWAEPLLEFDVGENPIRTEVATVPLEPRDGWMVIPDGPGLGIEIDEDAVRRLTAAA